nr:uncharacterized protein LOC120975547 [Aegilops tauschii subsp. strangulata]
MAFANGLKLAALCVLVLTMGQMMAVLAGTEYFPAATVTIDDKRRRSEATLINLDPAPSWLETHVPNYHKTLQGLPLQPGYMVVLPSSKRSRKTLQGLPLQPCYMVVLPSSKRSRKTLRRLPLQPRDMGWCCPPASGVAKPSEFCICTPEKWWCCPPISGVAKPSEDCLCSPATWFCCPEASGVAKPSED